MTFRSSRMRIGLAAVLGTSVACSSLLPWVTANPAAGASSGPEASTTIPLHYAQNGPTSTSSTTLPGVPAFRTTSHSATRSECGTEPDRPYFAGQPVLTTPQFRVFASSTCPVLGKRPNRWSRARRVLQGDPSTTTPSLLWTLTGATSLLSRSASAETTSYPA